MFCLRDWCKFLISPEIEAAAIPDDVAADTAAVAATVDALKIILAINNSQG